VSRPLLAKPVRIGGAVALAAVVNCTEHTPSPPDIASPSPDAPRLPAATLACDTGNGGITLPSDFCGIIVTDGMGLIRHAAVRPNGDVYVAIRRAQDGSDNGGVLALRDTGALRARQFRAITAQPRWWLWRTSIVAPQPADSPDVSAPMSVLGSSIERRSNVRPEPASAS
jgi:hypothetical protein